MRPHFYFLSLLLYLLVTKERTSYTTIEYTLHQASGRSIGEGDFVRGLPLRLTDLALLVVVGFASGLSERVNRVYPARESRLCGP